MAIPRHTQREMDICLNSLKTCLSMRGVDVEGWYLENYKPGGRGNLWRVAGPNGSHPLGLAFYTTREVMGAMRFACAAVQEVPISHDQAWKERVGQQC